MLNGLGDSLVDHVRKKVQEGHELRVTFDNFDLSILTKIIVKAYQNCMWFTVASNNKLILSFASRFVTLMWNNATFPPLYCQSLSGDGGEWLCV